MLKMIADSQIITVILGVLTFIGVGSKCIVNIQLKRLVRAAGNMSKSNHALMRLVRAKFEHACMVSEKVENVEVFVDKYLYEYRVFAVRLYSLRRVENIAAFLCVAAGLAGAAAIYSVHGMEDSVLRTGVTGAGLGILVYVFHLSTDENHRMQMIKNYMVDYLQNVCLHRYEKAQQREAEAKKLAMEQNGPEETEELFDEDSFEEASLEEVHTAEILPFEEADAKILAAEENAKTAARIPAEEKEMENQEKPMEKDVLIRQILEEFMA